MCSEYKYDIYKCNDERKLVYSNTVCIASYMSGCLKKSFYDKAGFFTMLYNHQEYLNIKLVG